MLKIVRRCEEKYGYKSGDHQRVIVEHIKDGRQHFHVMWCRVSLTTGKAVWPGHHWNKSKQVCREMEKELGLKTPLPRRVKKMWSATARAGRSSRYFGRYQTLQKSGGLKPIGLPKPPHYKPDEKSSEPFKPVASTKGWPPAAIIDWESWGSKDPERFFKLWSELSSGGFSPLG